MKKFSSSNSKTNHDLRSFDDIRTLLHHAYLYGTSSDSDILESGISDINKRELAYMWNRFNDYFHSVASENQFLQTHNLPGRKQNKKAHRISYDPFQSNTDMLASTYRHFSINANDLIFYLFFLFCFSADEDSNPYYVYWSDSVDEDEINSCSLSPKYSFTAGDVEIAMLNFYKTNSKLVSNKLLSDKDFPLSKMIIHRQLNDMAEQGFLSVYTKEKNCHYRFYQDVFPENKVAEFYSLAHFFYNITPMVVPGYFVKDHLFSRIIYDSSYSENDIRNFRNNLFFFSKTNLQNLLDEELMWEFFGYMSYDYEGKQMLVLPIKFVLDWQFGRQYLFGYCYDTNNTVTHRVDLIKNVQKTDTPKKAPMHIGKICKNLTFTDRSQAYFHALMDSSWSIGARAKTEPVKIYITLPKDTSFRNYYLKKLFRTPFGADIVTKKSDTEYEINISVTQPHEMIPWIQGFGKYARVDQEICPDLYAKLEKNKMETRTLYETV